MIVWVGFGLVLGASSSVMGWRLLKKTVNPKKQRGEQRRTGRRYIHVINNPSSLSNSNKIEGAAAKASKQLSIFTTGEQ